MPSESSCSGSSRLNFTHLDRIGEEIDHGGAPCRIVHIYAKAPDYNPSADPHEGTACVDDAARAAVVYLRHYETTGAEASRAKAEGLLRFVMYMQRDNGLFHNFVLNNRLEINRTHRRSRAEMIEPWVARAVWCLGVGARVLRDVNPGLSRACVGCVVSTIPHLEALLMRYPQRITHHGRTAPTWLIGEDAADITAELLLGLTALQKAKPTAAVEAMIARFAEGIAMMRYGSMAVFPYGLHASGKDDWHAWGNAQTEALAEAGVVASAQLEAEHFYPRLLVLGWLDRIPFERPHARSRFPQIAYGTRCVAVGLIRLYEATGDERYAIMAGLAASWFMGNNVVGLPTYDPVTGRGYDGIDTESRISEHAGAESTIEALYTILEIERHAKAQAWLDARGGSAVRISRDGDDLHYRVFTARHGEAQQRTAILMNPTQEKLDVLAGDRLDAFLTREAAD